MRFLWLEWTTQMQCLFLFLHRDWDRPQGSQRACLLLSSSPWMLFSFVAEAQPAATAAARKGQLKPLGPRRWGALTLSLSHSRLSLPFLGGGWWRPWHPSLPGHCVGSDTALCQDTDRWLRLSWGEGVPHCVQTPLPTFFTGLWIRTLVFSEG